MEYTQQELEQKLKKLSLEAIELMNEMRVLSDTQTVIYKRQLELKSKIAQLQEIDAYFPDYLSIREQTLESVLSEARLKEKEKYKLYESKLSEIDNVIEDLNKLKKQSLRRSK